jgi:hypothetical protein
MRSRRTRAVLTGVTLAPHAARVLALTDTSRAATRMLQSDLASRSRPGREGAYHSLSPPVCRVAHSPAARSDALAPVLYAQAKADPDAIFQNPSKTCRCVRRACAFGFGGAHAVASPVVASTRCSSAPAARSATSAGEAALATGLRTS